MTTEELINSELSPLVVADAYSNLLGNLPVDFHQFHVAIDLMNRKFVKIYNPCRELQSKAVRSHHNETVIKQWIKKTNIDLSRPQLSEIENFYFTRIRAPLVVASHLWDRRYAFFIQLSVSADKFEEIMGGASHLQSVVAKYKTLDKAVKTPICYLDELVSHFTLPVPPGLKCLAVFRLFLVEDDDNSANSKKMKFED